MMKRSGRSKIRMPNGGPSSFVFTANEVKY